MDIMDVIRNRHSVRQFTDKPLEDSAVDLLKEEIDLCNRESGFHFQLIINEPEAFQAEKPSYGQFKGCRNYLTIIKKLDTVFFSFDCHIGISEFSENTFYILDHISM